MRKLVPLIPPAILGLVSFFLVNRVSFCSLKSFLTVFCLSLLIELFIIRFYYKNRPRSKFTHFLRRKLEINISTINNFLSTVQQASKDSIYKFIITIILLASPFLGWQGWKSVIQPEIQLCCQSEMFKTSLRFRKSSSPEPIKIEDISPGENVLKLELDPLPDSPGVYSGGIWAKKDKPYYFIRYSIGTVDTTFRLTPDFDSMKIEETILVQHIFLEDFIESLTEITQ